MLKIVALNLRNSLYLYQQQQQNTNTMKNLATLLKEAQEANKNLAKFIKLGNDQAALMWAEKLQKIENQIEAL